MGKLFVGLFWGYSGVILETAGGEVGSQAIVSNQAQQKDFVVGGVNNLNKAKQKISLSLRSSKTIKQKQKMAKWLGQ